MNQEEIDAEIDAEIEFEKQMDEYANKRKEVFIQKLNEADRMRLKLKEELKEMDIDISDISIIPKDGWENYIDKEIKNWKNGNQQRQNY